jgi:DNA polymerase I-like protein with 3'-5' exonuclease and polymerase domains
MDLITIDTETYYDKEYSLSKMTTEQYIRDPRFEVIGVAIKINDQEVDWYSGSNVARFLRSIDWSNKAALAHNAAFDGFILSHHFDIHPAFWFDTMSMARPFHANGCGVSLKALAKEYGLQDKGDEVVHALGKRRTDFTPAELERYATYCIGDVQITYDLFRKLREKLPAPELRTINTTIKMFTEPSLVLDKARLEAHLDAERKRKEKLLAKLGGDKAKTLIMSNPKFAELLLALGVDPPTKLSPTTGKITYAFAKNDQDFLALQEHENPRVQAVVSARLGTKSTLEETRTESFIGISERGPLPIMLNYYGAHTGRFSGGDKVNLQNLPRGGALRKSICAPEDHTLITCDLSQIEARILAWGAGQTDLVEAFRNGEDVYSKFASDTYGVPVTKADKEKRFVGKTCILGLGFRVGAPKLQTTLAIGQGGIKVDIPDEEARRIVKLYRLKNHRIVAFWELCKHALNTIHAGSEFDMVPGVLRADAQGIRLPNGMYITYPKLKLEGNDYQYVSDMRMHRRNPDNGWTKIYDGKVCENIVQALARIVIVEHMNKIAKHYRVVMQVHDEIIVSVHSSIVNEARQHIEQIMRTPPKWAPDLPVDCESGIGANYGEAK